MAGTLSEKNSKESLFMSMQFKWLGEIVHNSLVGVRHVLTNADIFTELLPTSTQSSAPSQWALCTAAAIVIYVLFGTWTLVACPPTTAV